MKKLIIGIVLFIAIVFIIDTIIFYSLNFFYKRTYIGQEGGDINKYINDPAAPQLVIMGSSTARFQINPDSFPVKACNLAHSMTTDCYQLGLLSIMLKNHKIPKNIILSIWPRNYLLNGKDAQPEDILYLKYYYNTDYIKKEINNITPFERFKFWFSSYRFNGMVINTIKYYFTGLGAGNKYFFKYQEAFANDSINVVNGLKAVQKTESFPLPLSLIQTGYLNRFIDSCKKYNINLMCYNMPMLKEDTIQVKNSEKFLDSIFAKKGIAYFKFSETNSPDLFSNFSYWVDGEHMNYKGGAIQSRILANFVKPLIKY